MKSFFIILSILLIPVIFSHLLDNPTSLFAQNLSYPDELLSQDFLRSRTWKADKGLEAVVRNWTPYREKQDFEDRKIVSSADVKLLGITFRAEYRLFKQDSFGEIVILHKDDYNDKFCARLLSFLVDRLGKARKIIDRSIIEKDGGYYRNTADWLLGQTRIQIDCSGAVMNGSYIPALAVLIYRHQEYLSPLEDLIYVECSSTKKYVGPLFTDRPVEQSAPVVVVIDPNERSLRRRDNSLFLKTTKFTEDEIVASEETDKGNQEFRLDRRAGSYLWHIRAKPDTRNGIEIWGKCSRVEPGRKF